MTQRTTAPFVLSDGRHVQGTAQFLELIIAHGCNDEFTINR